MKKILAISLCVLLLVTALVGCSGSYEDSFAMEADKAAFEMPEEIAYGSLNTGSMHAYDSNAYSYNETTAAVPAEPVQGDAVSANRKLIRRVSLSMETEGYDALLNDINVRIAAVGGYVESLNADTRYSSDSRYATMTVRVPADRLDEFVNAVSGISNVVQRSENTEDVTLSYVDLESHASALRTEQERLIALLAEADNLSEILEIEDRLTSVRYELEYMESQLRTYDNLIDFATVTLSISEVKVLTPVQTEEKGFWEKIGDGLTNSLSNVWEGLKTFFSFLIIALPYLAVIAVVVGIILLIIFLCIKRSRKKAANRQPAPMPQQPPVMQRPPMPPVVPQPPVSNPPEQKDGK